MDYNYISFINFIIYKIIIFIKSINTLYINTFLRVIKPIRDIPTNQPSIF